MVSGTMKVEERSEVVFGVAEVELEGKSTGVDLSVCAGGDRKVDGDSDGFVNVSVEEIKVVIKEGNNAVFDQVELEGQSASESERKVDVDGAESEVVVNVEEVKGGVKDGNVVSDQVALEGEKIVGGVKEGEKVSDQGELDGKVGLELSCLSDDGGRKVEGGVDGIIIHESGEEVDGGLKEGNVVFDQGDDVVSESFVEKSPVEDGGDEVCEEKTVVEVNVGLVGEEKKVREEGLGVNLGIYAGEEVCEEKIVVEVDVGSVGEESKEVGDEGLGVSMEGDGDCSTMEEKTILEPSVDSARVEESAKDEQSGVTERKDVDSCNVEGKDDLESTVDASKGKKQVKYEWGLAEEESDSCSIEGVVSTQSIDDAAKVEELIEETLSDRDDGDYCVVENWEHVDGEGFTSEVGHTEQEAIVECLDVEQKKKEVADTSEQTQVILIGSIECKLPVVHRDDMGAHSMLEANLDSSRVMNRPQYLEGSNRCTLKSEISNGTNGFVGFVFNKGQVECNVRIRGTAPVDSSAKSYDEKSVDEEVSNRSIFRYIIKIPKYFDDEIYREAQEQIDEKIHKRAVTSAAVFEQKATFDGYCKNYEDSKMLEQTARDVLNAKRREMDSVHSMFNRIRNAISIEELTNSIRAMEYKIEHETLKLKEEQQLICEISRTKRTRDQLFSSIGGHSGVQWVLQQKIEIENRFQVLKKEIDDAWKEVLRLEEVTKAARKAYLDENEKLRGLQAENKAADDELQDAFAHIRNLRKQFYDKSESFHMYKEDARIASDFAYAKNAEALEHHCLNQVDKVMDLWNKNDDFRKDYIRCNQVSTLRRFGTLDGRSLGPDDQQPTVEVPHDKVSMTPLDSAKPDSILPGSSSEQEKPVLHLEFGQEKAAALSLEHNDPADESRKDAKTIVLENSPAPVYEVEQEKTQKISQSREEEGTKIEEDLRKEEAVVILREQQLLEKNSKVNATVEERVGLEELRKKEETAILGEQQLLKENSKADAAKEQEKEEEATLLRKQPLLEEKAKVDAEERKKKNAEKFQARAEVKAQKDTELREKQKMKKERSKERKKAAAAEASDTKKADAAEALLSIQRELSDNGSENAAPASTQEPGTQVKPKGVSKRTLTAPSVLARQKRVTAAPAALPPPLRNCNRTAKRIWIKFSIAALFCLVAYFGGKQIVSFSKPCLASE